uniref:C-type lectin domain-containing protein n=1 Tax=Myripristis murdjan TaxID=586833 RepID=A0A667ZAV1_9TELE
LCKVLCLENRMTPSDCHMIFKYKMIGDPSALRLVISTKIYIDLLLHLMIKNASNLITNCSLTGVCFSSLCKEMMHFLSALCALSEGFSRQFHFVSLKKNWTESFCRKSYTDLASIRSQKELEEILRTVDPGSSKLWWIGLFRDSWKWSDQSDLSFTMWENGEPDNNLENEFCACYNGKKWHDVPCSKTVPFFCYSGEFHP